MKSKEWFELARKNIRGIIHYVFIPKKPRDKGYIKHQLEMAIKYINEGENEK